MKLSDFLKEIAEDALRDHEQLRELLNLTASQIEDYADHQIEIGFATHIDGPVLSHARAYSDCGPDSDLAYDNDLHSVFIISDASEIEDLLDDRVSNARLGEYVAD